MKKYTSRVEGMKGTKLFVGIFLGTWSVQINKYLNGTLLKSVFFLFLEKHNAYVYYTFTVCYVMCYVSKYLGTEKMSSWKYA